MAVLENKQFKIPFKTAQRKTYKSAANLKIMMIVDCPMCGAVKGYYCVAVTGKKSSRYHTTRLDAYIKISAWYNKGKRNAK